MDFFYRAMYGTREGNLAYEMTGRGLLPAQEAMAERVKRLYIQACSFADSSGGLDRRATEPLNKLMMVEYQRS